jgi:circadian clock protein KaiC
VNDARDGYQLQKIPTGIAGFDELSRGGLPRGRTTVIVGGPGTGKTVFALQTLAEGARRFHEPGLFVAFEENARQVVENASGFGWDLSPGCGVEFLDSHLSADSVRAGSFDIAALLAAIGMKARAIGARRIVFDAIDVLLSMINDPQSERVELYRLRDWLAENGFTGIITSRGHLTDGQSTDGDFLVNSVLYMADCIILLRRSTICRIALRSLQILKYRGSLFGQNEYPIIIGEEGIEISGLAATQAQVSEEKITTGVARLDAMLGGGYFRGTSTLITGAPGTAKSTLGVAFANASCERGERVLYVAFDETADELMRNLRSIGIDLRRHVDAGTLRILALRPGAQSADEYMALLLRGVNAWNPHCLVIDPLSALLKAGGEVVALITATEIIRGAKARGVTVVATSLTGSADPLSEQTDVHVSTVADNWIHLSFAVQAGERNRGLTIIKARGMGHSRQVRELVISDSGVSLSDVYTAGGEVIMGTLRVEKENADEVQRQGIRLELERKRREFEIAEAEIRARMAALESELQSRREQFELTAREHEAKERLWESQRRSMEQLRGGDRQ